jgi:hypothetical protein
MDPYFPNIDLFVRMQLNSYVSPKAEIRNAPVPRAWPVCDGRVSPW